MSEDTTAIESGRETSFFSKFLNLYFAPAEGFLGLLRRPAVLIPLLALVTVNLAFTAVWLQKVDAREFMKAQIEESGRWDQIPAASRESVLDSQAKWLPVFGWVGALLGGPLFVLAVAALYLFIFRFFYASEVNFRQALSLVATTFLAVSVITSSLTLLILFLKGDWAINPQHALQANASVLLEKDSVPKALYSLAESLDVFSFWSLGLLSVGFGLAAKRPVASALWGVAAPWLIYVLGKVAIAAMF